MQPDAKIIGKTSMTNSYISETALLAPALTLALYPFGHRSQREAGFIKIRVKKTYG